MSCSNIFGVMVSAILLCSVTDTQGKAYKYRAEIHGGVSHKKVIATWEEAKQRCQSEGAVLVSPIDNDLLEYMKSSIGANNHTTPYFIGMKAVGNPELIFVSVEGILLDNLPEGAMDMIEQLNPKAGDCLSMDRYNIRVVTCRTRLPYLCIIPNTKTMTETQSTAAVTTQATTEATTEVTTQATTEATTEVTTQAMTEATTEVSSHTMRDGTTEMTTQPTAVTPCSSGYKLYPTGSCYKVHLQERDWDDAQSTCVSEGGYLAVINNEYEAQVIGNFAFLETVSNWVAIGLRDYKKDGHWTSVHKDPIDQIYNIWAESRSNDRYCGSLKRVGGKVDDQYCAASYPFVCEVASDCGSGYKHYPTGSCYKVHLQTVAWDDAQSTCVSEGGYLAVINNEYEAQLIRNFAFLETDSNWVAIGLRDYKEDGHWTSVHKDPIDQIYNIWAESRSNDRYCGSLKRVGGKVDDQYCSVEYPFVCERNPRETTEVTTQTTTEATTELTTQATTEPTTELTTQPTTVATSECGSGYKLYPTGSCYKVHLQKVYWDDAQFTCVSEGGYLAVINNEYEAQVIGTFAFLETDSNWITIGLRDYKEDGHWTSVHKDPIDQIYNIWAESRSNDRYCGSLKRVGGKVDDQYCSVEYPFVCERNPRETTEVTTQTTTEATTELTTQATTEPTTELTTQPTTVATSECGSGYKLYPTGSCYKVHLQKVYWDDAQFTCVSEGGYLAVINNEYEAQVIGTFAFLETDSNWITIGLRDYKEDGHWTSVHKDPIDQIYNIWAESRSNDRYCGSLKRVGGKVDDQYCSVEYPFVCERNPRETTEVTTQTTTEATTELTTQATTEPTTELTTQPTTVATSECGSGYKLYPTGSCYKVHLQKVYWDDAQFTCVFEGGYLAVINNEYEAQVIGTFAFLETDSNWITIGLRDYKEDGHWNSVHDDPIDQIYNVWAESKSNDRYCGSLKKVGGKLDDQYCRAGYPFVCERLVTL